MRKFTLHALLLVLGGLAGCSGPDWVQQYVEEDKEVVHAVPDSVQLPLGDPMQGFQYLLYANYIGSGYPLALLPNSFRSKLDSANLPASRQALDPSFSFVKDMRHRVWIVQKNCFTCHGSTFQGQYTPGLGNPYSDFTKKPGLLGKVMPVIARKKLGKATADYQAFNDLWQYLQVVDQKSVAAQVGPNPAFRIEEACAMHRNPQDLRYSPQPQFELKKGPVPVADVPPLWHVAKKRALYYNGMGRGDFRKLLMQASVLGIKDSADARRVYNRFGDVVAWAASLEPPKWPKPVNTALAERGQIIFAKNCSKCHGSYEGSEAYPNKIIPLSKIGTDPHYARYFYQHSGLAGWYNQSWFAQSEGKSQMLPSLGYVAPPLDGIWATAPYLHNGSVPTLESLLNSAKRPQYWQRNTEKPEYDYEQVGWKHTAQQKPGGKGVYNTQLAGYGNGGHTYGDKLSDEERTALIEYLKTL